MKKNLLKIALGAGILGGVVVALVAADHVDSPNVAGTSSDIADVFAFEGQNADNTVFVVTMDGPIAPGNDTQDAQFDENVLVNINIDNTGDFVEDLVIQAIRRGDNMYFFGPAVPGQTGLSKTIITSADQNVVAVSSPSAPVVEENNGMMFYAGARRDPFFFDFNRFNMVVGGQVAPAGFLPSSQADDFFSDLNVLAIAVEVPNSMLGNAPAHVAGSVGIMGLPDAYNVWVTTNRKQ